MNTAAATDAVFISPALIRAARGAAALDQRIGHFTHLTIKVNHHFNGWSLTGDAVLRYAEGGVLYVSPFRPVDESSPFAEQSRRRFAAAEELRALVAELPFTGEALAIPLHAVA
ncbi:hypothetical protein [Streptomyces scabiei]|uniref:hypothetical protein n=1 Tax=Streptomyces scabiei TaxID=1930 RepID=UPI001B3253AD|nr:MULTISPECIES: hypothetical protein [Streptomyces]MBP5896350.1 hypothetical protein [Streptomyces sp. LBUM 1481]MDX3298632.1 hypothetical protein [Streptomyces scabiei]